MGHDKPRVRCLIRSTDEACLMQIRFVLKVIVIHGKQMLAAEAQGISATAQDHQIQRPDSKTTKFVISMGGMLQCRSTPHLNY